MNKRMKRICVIILILSFFFGSTVGFRRPSAASTNSSAVKKARKIGYTVKKGKTKKINNIVKSSSLKKKTKKKSVDLTWKSDSPKTVKVIKNQKIRGMKAGKTYIRGYNKKNKNVISIYVTVQPPSKPKLIRTTSAGKVKGRKNSAGTAMIWYGVPYGADTGGENRWKAPQPVEPWSGVRKTRSKKKGALRASGDSYTGTEDCLYVNVYRPYSKEKDLPVMVYLHGGSNNSGSANMDFTKLAVKTNSVIVTVSFRLGAFGFLSHPALRDGTPEENSGNFALLDIRQALCWVRDEIGNFGGDADNVTLSGFSAGARDALMCMISPMMQGLFHKAIILSGGMTVSTPQEGESSVEKKLASILVERGRYEKKSEALDYIQSVSHDTIRGLFYSLTKKEIAQMYKTFNLRMENFPQGFTDGVVLPKDGFNVISTGNYNQVPVILGSDATEFSSFAWKDNSFFSYSSIFDTLVFDTMDLLGKGIKYGSQLQSAYNVEETAAYLTGDVNHEPIYAFRFCWGTNAAVTDSFYSQYVGAYHGASRDFLRGVYSNNKEYSPDVISAENKKGRTALTAQMRSYIKNFMAKGNPNGAGLTTWNTWKNRQASKKIMNFNASRQKATSNMSVEKYDQTMILYTMTKDLTEQEYDFLTDIVLKGRYFMPPAVLKLSK